MILGLIEFLGLSLIAVVLIWFWARCRLAWKRRWYDGNYERVAVAFFHPYCNGGGGGEKVLWCGIDALQKRYSEIDIIIYTGDQVSEEEILGKARRCFNIELNRPVRFVYLKWRRLLEANLYRVFTLLGQSIGGLLVGLEAVFKYCPDVFIESTGFSFTLPLFRYVGGCRVACYVHYPTISTDMLKMVAERRPTYNNRDTIARNKALTWTKLFYYKLFAWIYGLAGKASHIVIVNSTWTGGHIRTLWKRNDVNIIYPPCSVTEFLTISPSSESIFDHEIRILSVGQFRPEKDHRKQVEILKRLKSLLEPDQWTKLKWIFLGGCRHKEDLELMEEMKKLAMEWEVNEKLEFKVNATFDELKEELGRALIGVHTMWNEHFGIGVVDHMAAGNIMIAHDSGGPKDDILVEYDGEEVGFLADTVDSYAEMIKRVIEMTPEQRERIRRAARSSVKEKFDERLFNDGFTNVIDPIL